MALAVGCCAALVVTTVSVASASGRRFTAGTRVSCSISSASATCQTANSAKTVSATVSRSGAVTVCERPRGAARSCLSSTISGGQAGFSGAGIFEQIAGPFACIPLGSPYTRITGTVCTVVGLGKGFEIAASGVTRVAQLPSRPEPACTSAALWDALVRYYHAASPSRIVGTPVCAGGYASGGWEQDGNDNGFVFKSSGGSWGEPPDGVCEAGVIPAVVWKAAQGACFAN
jgi:hypothetical protein